MALVFKCTMQVLGCYRKDIFIDFNASLKVTVSNHEICSDSREVQEFHSCGHISVWFPILKISTVLK